MKYLVTFFWSFLLSHVVCYLGATLTSTAYDTTQASLLGIALAIAVLCIQLVIPLKKESHESKASSTN